MKHVELLLPFALPHNELATDLLRQARTPALASLISRAKAAPRMISDPFARALPHEQWIGERFGVAADHAEENSPRIAVGAMRTCGVQVRDGNWFLLQPVHIHFARDHLVLTDLRQLVLAEPEARTLFDIAQSLFGEIGHDIRYGNERMWFLRADDWSELRTATPDAATGHNIDIWMPKGTNERAWRKVQNEVQMHWHQHPVNIARAEQGKKPVNSLWLWGSASTSPQAVKVQYQHGFNLPDWIRGSASASTEVIDCKDANEVIAATSSRSIVMADALIEAALSENWSDWLVQLAELEQLWFAPLLAAIKSGKIDQLTLIMTHNTGLIEFSVNRLALHKFWINPSLARLAP